jgi:S-adenosylmethionine synthetase
MKTAEFVSPKHPDKLCDRVSDALLDLFLTNDENARCAIEVCGGHSKIFITGEVTSTFKPDDTTIIGIVKQITEIEDVIIHLNTQSPEISRGVDTGGAGDQGIMIGYACNDNEEMVPQEYYLARKLNKFIYSYFPYDGKTQVTINGDNVRVVCSFQKASKSDLELRVKEFFSQFNYKIESLLCNPAGDWNIGGLQADAGLTGRKLAVDNYGPRIPIGGGAFSGKDATKVDRSAAYMARKIAVDYLKLYGCREVFVTLGYAIGYDQPLHATVKIDGIESDIKGYDLSPRGIINFLDLKKPIFSKTCEWGHMGNKFNWE